MAEFLTYNASKNKVEAQDIWVNPDGSLVDWVDLVKSGDIRNKLYDVAQKMNTKLESPYAWYSIWKKVFGETLWMSEPKALAEKRMKVVAEVKGEINSINGRLSAHLQQWMEVLMANLWSVISWDRSKMAEQKPMYWNPGAVKERKQRMNEAMHWADNPTN